MDAGRELDVLIAEKVMGLSVASSYWSDVRHKWEILDDGVPYVEVLPYSTDIAAAWRVWERVSEPGWHIDREREGYSISIDDGRWGVDIFASASTFPLVVCLAALKAVGVNDA